MKTSKKSWLESQGVLPRFNQGFISTLKRGAFTMPGFFSKVQSVGHGIHTIPSFLCLKKNKGQAALYDLMIAFMMFLMAFSLLNSVWTKNFQSAVGSLSMSEMEAKTLQALNVLLKTQGYPKNWDESNVEIIGIAERKNAVSESRLDAFTSLDYSTAKEKLKLGQYDFRFEFDAHGELEDVNFGSVPGIEESVVSSKRIVEFKEGSAVVYFKVFK